MTAPDFICIGAQKAATTWLSANLARHPEIWLPFTKELHYFDMLVAPSADYWRDNFAAKISRMIERAKTHRAPERRIAYLESIADPTRMFTPEWYRAVFAAKPEGRITGEFTPRYATLPEAAIEGMLRALPETKFIYLIRDPTDRALSNFRMQLSRSEVNTADSQEVERFARDWFAARRFFASDYAVFIPRWDARCPKERLLYLPFGAVRAAPREILREVEVFLGLTPFEAYGAETAVHRSKSVTPPSWLAPRLEAELAPHRAFLERRFPADFVAALR
ncbi:MAG: sulfotransferase [Paracoccaceae bacterium]